MPQIIDKITLIYFQNNKILALRGFFNQYILVLLAIYKIKGTVMQIEKPLINGHLRVSKVF